MPEFRSTASPGAEEPQAGPQIRDVDSYPKGAIQRPMLMDQIVDFIRNSNELTPLAAGVLGLAFVVSGLVLIPRAAVCTLAGAAYGLVAIPVALPSATVGALMAFLVARYLAAAYVQRLVGRQRLLHSIARAVDHEGWRIVALTRFGGPIPGSVASYLFGLTNIDWWSFTWATFVFCIPQVVLFTCLGAAGREAMLGDSTSILGQVLIAIGVITGASTIFLVARRARLTFAALQNDK